MRPNVVVFISHDTGRFLSPYGYDTVVTPNFERLARMATTFHNAFCTSPLCAPARAALLTGLHPHQNGMMGLPGDRLGGWDLRSTDRHLAAVFAANGYESVLCGFEHEAQDFRSVGFERAIHGSGTGHNGGEPLRGVSSSLSQWFAERARGTSERPFYLQIGCHETHREWTKFADPFDNNGVWKAPYLIDSPEIDREMAEFQGAVNALDAGLGEVLDTLDAAGELEDTILVVTTDHGIDLPRAKGTLYDPGTEVCLFLAWAGGRWRSDARTGELVSHVDVYPTVLEACGIEPPAGTVGRSLQPLLTSEDGWTPRPAVYSEKTCHNSYEPIRALRTDRYKYIVTFDAHGLQDVRIATAPRYSWFRFPIKKEHREELYDLEVDPWESDNRVNDPQLHELRDGFKRQLAVWMRQTNDPLLDGPIPSPYHRRVSDEMRELAAVHGVELQDATGEMAPPSRVLPHAPSAGETPGPRAGGSTQDKLLIVHLDDMGSSHAANAAGRELLELGIATSASVMMPCDWAWDFVSWWRDHPGHDIGVHLTMTCERRTMSWSALADRGAAPSLYDADGLLHATSAAVAEHARAADVAREIDRQVELALRWGMRPSHLDCHMWFVETRSEFFAAYVETARRHGLVPHVHRRALEDDQLRSLVPEEVPLVNPHADSTRERAPGDTYEERRATVWESFERMEPGLNVVPLHVSIDTPEIRAIMPAHPGAKRSWRDRVWAYEIYRDPQTRQRIADARLRLVSWGEVASGAV